MSEHRCLVLTGRRKGDLIPDERVAVGDFVVSAVGFNPEAPTLGKTVVDLTECMEVEPGGLRCGQDCADYRLIVWVRVAQAVAA